MGMFADLLQDEKKEGGMFMDLLQGDTTIQPPDEDMSALWKPGVDSELYNQAFPEQTARPKIDELIDASARGLASTGSAGANVMSKLSQVEIGSPFRPPTAPGPVSDEQKQKEVDYWKEQASFLWEVSKNPGLASQNKDIASKALNLIGETLPYITATTAGYMAAGPAGGFMVGSLVEGNSAYRTALDYNVPDDKAKAIGVSVGIVSGAIESVGGQYAEELFKKASERIRNKLLRTGAKFSIGMIIEGLEEGSQEIAQMTGESYYRDINWKEGVNRTLSSAAGGVFLGGVMKGGGTAVRVGTMQDLTADINRQAPDPKEVAKNLGISEELARDLITKPIDELAPDTATQPQPAARTDIKKEESALEGEIVAPEGREISEILPKPQEKQGLTEEIEKYTPTEAQKAPEIGKNIVYHGTPDTTIKELASSKYGDLGKGLYLTRDKNIARNFSDMAFRSATLEAVGDGTFQDINTGKIIKPKAPGIIEVDISNLKIKQITAQEFNKEIEKLRDSKGVLPDDYETIAQEKYKQAGYDGIEITGSNRGESDQIVVFPDSIKKVIKKQEPQQAPEVYQKEGEKAKLIEQAKKYKTFDEFAESVPVKSRAEKRQAIRNWIKETGYKPKDSSFDRGDSIHAPADPESGAPLYDLADNEIYPEDVYSANGFKYYNTGEEKMDSKAYDIISSAEGLPNKQVKVYRAVEKGDPQKILPGDWVTTVRAYAKEHGEGTLKGEYKIVSKTVRANEIFTSGDSWLEYGYHPQMLVPPQVYKKIRGALAKIYDEAHPEQQISEPTVETKAKPKIIKKSIYTSTPKEWISENDLYDWGRKGLRSRGNRQIGNRKTFVWQNEYDTVPVRLPKSTYDALRARTDEVFKVHVRKGDDYYLAPKRVVQEVKEELGKEAFKQKPKPERTEKQKINDFINAAKRRNELTDSEIGAVIEQDIKELGLTEDEITDNMKKYLRALENDKEKDAIRKDFQIGMEQEVSGPEEIEERLGIQGQGLAEEIGDFLDGIVESEEKPRPEHDIEGQMKIESIAKANTDKEVEAVTKDLLNETSARKADIKEDRQALGLNPMPSAGRKTWQKSLQDAKNLKIPEKALRLAQEIAENPRPLNDSETAGLVIRATELKKEHRQALNQIENTTDEAQIKLISAEISRIESEFEAITRALYLSGTEKGRALVSQKLTIDRDFDLISVKKRAKAAKGQELSKREADNFKIVTEQLEKTNQKMEEMQKRIDELTAEKSVRKSGLKKYGRMSAEQKAAKLNKTRDKVSKLLSEGCY